MKFPDFGTFFSVEWRRVTAPVFQSGVKTVIDRRSGPPRFPKWRRRFHVVVIQSLDRSNKLSHCVKLQLKSESLRPDLTLQKSAVRATSPMSPTLGVDHCQWPGTKTQPLDALVQWPSTYTALGRGRTI